MPGHRLRRSTGPGSPGNRRDPDAVASLKSAFRGVPAHATSPLNRPKGRAGADLCSRLFNEKCGVRSRTPGPWPPGLVPESLARLMSRHDDVEARRVPRPRQQFSDLRGLLIGGDDVPAGRLPAESESVAAVNGWSVNGWSCPGRTPGDTGVVIESDEKVRCPFCGQVFEVRIDTSNGCHRLTMDCEVCCRPLDVAVECVPGEVRSIEVGD